VDEIMLKTGAAAVIVGNAGATKCEVYAWLACGGDTVSSLEGGEDGGLVDAVAPLISGRHIVCSLVEARC